MTKREREELDELKRIERVFGNKQKIRSKTLFHYPESSEREFHRKLFVAFGVIGIVLHDLLKKSKVVNGHAVFPAGAVAAAAKKIRSSVPVGNIEKEIKRAAKNVIAVNLKYADKAVESTFGFKTKFPSQFLEKKALDWDERTIASIKNYVNHLADNVENSTTEAQIRAVLGVQRHGARKMARLTVTDLNGVVLEAIQRRMGNESYIWRTSRDEKVRPCHASFDGKEFRWDSPPEIWTMKAGRRVYTGRHCHPGQDYNCRCTAIAVFKKDAILKLFREAGVKHGKKQD